MLKLEQTPGYVAHGVHHLDEDGSSCIGWARWERSSFPNREDLCVVEDVARTRLAACGAQPDGWDTGASHDCSGRTFAHPVHVHLGRRFVTTTQWCGRDI